MLFTYHSYFIRQLTNRLVNACLTEVSSTSTSIQQRISTNSIHDIFDQTTSHYLERPWSTLHSYRVKSSMGKSVKSNKIMIRLRWHMHLASFATMKWSIVVMDDSYRFWIVIDHHSARLRLDFFLSLTKRIDRKKRKRERKMGRCGRGKSGLV